MKNRKVWGGRMERKKRRRREERGGVSRGRRRSRDEVGSGGGHHQHPLPPLIPPSLLLLPQSVQRADPFQTKPNQKPDHGVRLRASERESPLPTHPPPLPPLPQPTLSLTHPPPPHPSPSTVLRPGKWSRSFSSVRPTELSVCVCETAAGQRAAMEEQRGRAGV